MSEDRLKHTWTHVVTTFSLSIFDACDMTAVLGIPGHDAGPTYFKTVFVIAEALRVTVNVADSRATSKMAIGCSWGFYSRPY